MGPRPSFRRDPERFRFCATGPTIRPPAVLLDGTIVRLWLRGGAEAVHRATMEADRPLTFEGYAVDLANERLLHEGEVLPLAPKAFAVFRRPVGDGDQRALSSEGSPALQARRGRRQADRRRSGDGGTWVGRPSWGHAPRAAR